MATSQHDFELGEFSPARALLAPLLEGKPVTLHVAGKLSVNNALPILFICPLSIFIGQMDMSELVDEEGLGYHVQQFDTDEVDVHRLIIGMPGGKMRLIDVRRVTRNELYSTGMSMRAARFLKVELEDLFGVDSEEADSEQSKPRKQSSD